MKKFEIVNHDKICFASEEALSFWNIYLPLPKKARFDLDADCSVICRSSENSVRCPKNTFYLLQNVVLLFRELRQNKVNQLHTELFSHPATHFEKHNKNLAAIHHEQYYSIR